MAKRRVVSRVAHRAKIVTQGTGRWLWVHKGPILCLVVAATLMGGGVGSIIRQMKLHGITWQT